MSTSAQQQRLSRTRIEQQRDQALRDLLELEQQVRAGEVPPGPAAELSRRYERTAAEALALLDGTQTVGEAVPRRGMTWRAVVYGVGGVAALVALVVVLPPALQERPDGGFVTGNEVTQVDPAPQPTSSTPGRDLSKVSDEEMERVVAANPEIVGMRLALAERYRSQGEFDKAVPHYREVLDREPDNAEALASLGWILLMLEEPVEAARLADQALQRDPALPLGWWLLANVRLYGQDDPDGAIEALQRMQELPLEPEVQGQAAALEQEARALAVPGSGE
ncbi:cytochrome C biosynthesis protein [Actinotalea ferrariae CF5-4]|uniref:Cytochrome C biosynthesis protein n=1 Tax=Actinotalea ferrariae CF5-4 TaxID=948458 RepID=A0A021VZK1_9CELL|nr:tetratricopeptide repeat protein [Actinotalea ferrariae]EYR64497.1 cytochrome C biosynthesis protein [Actinotalea ferrariae CF5-4]